MNRTKIHKVNRSNTFCTLFLTTPYLFQPYNPPHLFFKTLLYNTLRHKSNKHFIIFRIIFLLTMPVYFLSSFSLSGIFCNVFSLFFASSLRIPATFPGLANPSNMHVIFFTIFLSRSEVCNTLSFFLFALSVHVSFSLFPFFFCTFDIRNASEIKKFHPRLYFSSHVSSMAN